MSNCNDKDKASRNYDNADAKLESKSYFIKQPTYNQDSETEVGSHSHTEVYDGHPIPESAPTSPSEFVGVQQLQNSSIPIVDNKKGLQWTGIADDDLVDDGIPAPGCNVDSEIDAGVSASRPSHQPPHDTQVDSNTYDEDAPHVSDMRTELQLPDIANRTPSLATADVVTAPQHSSVKSSSSSDTSQLRQLDSALNRTPDGTSIAESGALHLEENGRTYHRYKEGAYWLPNDPVSPGPLMSTSIESHGSKGRARPA